MLNPPDPATQSVRHGPTLLGRLRATPAPDWALRDLEEHRRKEEDAAAEHRALLADLRREEDALRAQIDHERAEAEAALHARVAAERRERADDPLRDLREQTIRDMRALRGRRPLG